MNKFKLSDIAHKIGSVVEITWLDHYTTPVNNAYDSDELAQLGDSLVRVSVGTLVKCNKNAITLASNTEETGDYSGLLVIVASCIRAAGWSR